MPDAASLEITVFTVGPFQENTYLLVDRACGDAVLVDPGDEGARLVAAVRTSGARLVAIWLTHAHLDHVGAVAEVKRAWDVPVHLHRDDLPLLAYAPDAARMYGLPFEAPPPPEKDLVEGDVLSIGGYQFTVMHAPGHAPGHVVLHGHGVALVGDCLFAGSVGRTDLPLSNGADLARSLQRIAELHPDTRVLPGHGPATTIGAELASNPFLSGIARPVRR